MSGINALSYRPVSLCIPLVLSQISPVSFSFSFLPRNCRYNRLCKYSVVGFFLFCFFCFFPPSFCETSLEFSSPSHVEFQTLPRWVWQAAAARKWRLSGNAFTNTSNLVGLLTDMVTLFFQNWVLVWISAFALVRIDAGFSVKQRMNWNWQPTVNERGIADVCLFIHKIKQKSRQNFPLLSQVLT